MRSGIARSSRTTGATWDNVVPQQVYVAASPDEGRTWNAGIPISVAGEDGTQPGLPPDAPAGAAGYVGAAGFVEVYGDYGEIAVTNTGKTVAAWGKGFFYTGPGGTWVNVQR